MTDDNLNDLTRYTDEDDLPMLPYQDARYWRHYYWQALREYWEIIDAVGGYGEVRHYLYGEQSDSRGDDPHATPEGTG